MDLSSIITDNVTEVLVKVIDFADRRHTVLTRNILGVNTEDFLPMDLDVEQFANVMMVGVGEHIRSERLLLRDSENVKFGAGGDFESPAIVDYEAVRLFKEDIDAYIEFQIEKLSENLLNKKVAAQLLEQKHGQSRTAKYLNGELSIEGGVQRF